MTSSGRAKAAPITSGSGALPAPLMLGNFRLTPVAVLTLSPAFSATSSRELPTMMSIYISAFLSLMAPARIWASTFSSGGTPASLMRTKVAMM